MMFSTKESKVDTNFQPSLWNNTESIIAQNTAEDVWLTVENVFIPPPNSYWKH